MKNPLHPGEIVREECIKALGLTIEEAARGLGVSRSALSRLINGHASITPGMAVRLSKAFGSTPETWLRMQMNYDLAHASACAEDIHVEKFSTAYVKNSDLLSDMADEAIAAYERGETRPLNDLLTEDP
ncbi:MAG: HigA family addiction module antitoxin [Rhodothermales bacterium]|nr:HigA family addiction module antitoxin [Rhodothermales bacterium]